MDGDICASRSAEIAMRCLHTATSDTVAELWGPPVAKGTSSKAAQRRRSAIVDRRWEKQKGAKQRRSEAALRRGRARKRSPDAQSTGKIVGKGGKMDRSRRGDVGGSYRKTSKAAG